MSLSAPKAGGPLANKPIASDRSTIPQLRYRMSFPPNNLCFFSVAWGTRVQCERLNVRGCFGYPACGGKDAQTVQNSVHRTDGCAYEIAWTDQRPLATRASANP